MISYNIVVLIGLLCDIYKECAYVSRRHRKVALTAVLWNL